MGWWERHLDEVEGERRGYVDPLWLGIALAIGGVVGGLLVMLAA